MTVRITLKMILLSVFILSSITDFGDLVFSGLFIQTNDVFGLGRTSLVIIGVTKIYDQSIF